jgi:outer membrane protein
MKKYIYLILFTINFQGLAQINQELNSIVKNVLDHSPTLKGQKTLLSVGETKSQIQKSYADPTIAYEAGITRVDPVSKATFDTGPASTVLQFQPNMNYATNFIANQVLYDWGKNAQNIEKIRLENKLTQSQIDVMAFGMAYQIATIFHQIHYLKNVLSIQTSELKRIKDQAAIVEQQIKLGEAIELDAMGWRIKVSNHENKLSETQSQIEKLTDFLETQAGKELKKELTNTATLNQQNEGSIENNPSFKQLEAEKAILEQEINVQSKASSPTLSGIATLGIRNGYLPRINGETPPISEDFKVNSMLGLKLTVPIYSGKRALYQQNIAKIQQERVNYLKEEKNTQLAYEVRQGEVNLKNLQDKIALQGKVIEQAKYAYKLSEARYKEGTIKQLEIDQAQNTLEEAQLMDENFRLQIKLQQMELFKAKGLRFWEN